METIDGVLDIIHGFAFICHLVFFFLKIRGVTATLLRFLGVRLCREPGRGAGATKHMQWPSGDGDDGDGHNEKDNSS